MQAVKALILDCGGVICRPKRGHWLLASDLEEILGGEAPRYSAEQVAEAHACAAHWLDEGQLVTTERHEQSLRLAYAREMNARLGAELKDGQLEAIARSITWDDSRYVFYDDMRPYMEKWAGVYKLGLLSNAMPSIVRVLAHAGMYECCDSIIISCLCGFQKPDARMYARSLEELDVPAENAVFVDDLEDNLLAARRVGLKTVRMARDVYTLTPCAPFREWTGPIARDFCELDALLTGGLA